LKTKLKQIIITEGTIAKNYDDLQARIEADKQEEHEFSISIFKPGTRYHGRVIIMFMQQCYQIDNEDMDRLLLSI